MNKLKINYSSILLAIKVLLSLLITYLILSKGDAGNIVWSIGNFLVSGNGLVGLVFLVSIYAVYPAVVYNFTNSNSYLQKIRNSLIFFDSMLVCVNLFFGIFYHTKFANMPISDAFAKFIILACGSGIVYLLTGIIVLLLIKHFSSKENQELSKDIEICNNPLDFSGRIDRIPYLITKVICFAILIILAFIKQRCSDGMFDIYEIVYLISKQFIFILFFYAVSKRLRDIKLSQWFLLLWLIPLIGICIGLPLLFMKSKYIADNTEEHS